MIKEFILIVLFIEILIIPFLRGLFIETESYVVSIIFKISRIISFTFILYLLIKLIKYFWVM